MARTKTEHPVNLVNKAVASLLDLTEDQYEPLLTSIRIDIPTLHSFLTRPRVNHDKKTQSQYTGPRCAVKSLKVTPKEAPVMEALLKAPDHQLTTKMLVLAANTSINVVNGLLSMFIAKNFVTTERKSLEGEKVARWVQLTEAGKIALEDYYIEQKNPKPATSTATAKGSKPSPDSQLPLWVKELTVEQAIEDLEISGDCGDKLTDLAPDAYDEEIQLSSIWNKIPKKFQAELGKAYTVKHSA